MNHVETAIDKLVAEQPHLFDLEGPVGPGGFLILDLPAFYAGVARNLLAQGLCSRVDEESGQITVKIDNTYDQTFDIVSTQQRIRTGPSTYLGDCTPARYPQQPGGVVRMRVSFFRINCPPGIAVPELGSNQLPESCIGTITATPLDVNGIKLPLEVHGDKISWFFRLGGEEIVYVGGQPDGPFNQRLYTRNLGRFSICAEMTEFGVSGCLNADVVPAVAATPAPVSN